MAGTESDGSALGNARISGVRLIALMGLLALAATVFAIVFHYAAARKARVWWGLERAMLLRDAATVEMLVLAPTAPTRPPADPEAPLQSPLPESPPPQTRIAEVRDVSKASGILHVREQLLKDNSYRWGEKPAGGEPSWNYGLRFVDGGREVVVWFDTEHHWLGTADNGSPLSFEPVAAFVANFFERHR